MFAGLEMRGSCMMDMLSGMQVNISHYRSRTDVLETTLTAMQTMDDDEHGGVVEGGVAI